MKLNQILLSLLSIFAFFETSAQDCPQTSTQISMNVNNVNARLSNAGNLWRDGNDGGYIYPKPLAGSGNPEVSALYAGGLWLGAKDEAGDLKLAAATYGLASDRYDYFPGPLDVNGEVSQNTCDNFNRFFEVTNIEVNQHLSDFESDGVINETVPNSILGWPAIGNPNFFDARGFDLPNNTALAPFIDRNSNGIYEPMQGDYPNTKSADQAFWWVFNDKGGPHMETGGIPLGFEIQMMAYSYVSDYPAIDDATYYDLKIINKSNQNLTDFYASLWLDIDLGCFDDDLFGCIPDENLVFAYNKDQLDGQGNGCSCSGVNTYCDQIPVVGIKMLEGLTSFETGNAVDLGMTSLIYYNNAFIGFPPPGTTDPSIPQEYYNYMQGNWKDGTPLTFGGTGYNVAGGDFTPYTFPNNPIDLNGWSMCSEDQGIGDRRIIISSGPVDAPAGSVQNMSFAVIAQPNVQHPCPDISGLIEIGNVVESVFEDPTNTSEILYNNNQLTIQPNPFADQTTISFKELSQQIQSIKLYTIDGKLVKNFEGINENAFIINRGNLRSGMYLFALISTSGELMTGKLIVK